jgi:hypothetical protein
MSRGKNEALDLVTLSNDYGAALKNYLLSYIKLIFSLRISKSPDADMLENVLRKTMLSVSEFSSLNTSQLSDLKVISEDILGKPGKIESIGNREGSYAKEITVLKDEGEFLKAMSAQNENIVRECIVRDMSDLLSSLEQINKKLELADLDKGSEAHLVSRIKRIFPARKRQRYDELYAKFQNGNLTKKEHTELVKLSEEFESLNTQRLKYIGKLADLRGVSFKETVREFKV